MNKEYISNSNSKLNLSMKSSDLVNNSKNMLKDYDKMLEEFCISNNKAELTTSIPKQNIKSEVVKKENLIKPIIDLDSKSKNNKNDNVNTGINLKSKKKKKDVISNDIPLNDSQNNKTLNDRESLFKKVLLEDQKESYDLKGEIDLKTGIPRAIQINKEKLLLSETNRNNDTKTKNFDDSELSDKNEDIDDVIIKDNEECYNLSQIEKENKKLLEGMSKSEIISLKNEISNLISPELLKKMKNISIAGNSLQKGINNKKKSNIVVDDKEVSKEKDNGKISLINKTFDELNGISKNLESIDISKFLLSSCHSQVKLAVNFYDSNNFTITIELLNSFINLYLKSTNHQICIELERILLKSINQLIIDFSYDELLDNIPFKLNNEHGISKYLVNLNIKNDDLKQFHKILIYYSNDLMIKMFENVIKIFDSFDKSLKNNSIITLEGNLKRMGDLCKIILKLFLSDENLIKNYIENEINSSLNQTKISQILSKVNELNISLNNEIKNNDMAKVFNQNELEERRDDLILTLIKMNTLLSVFSYNYFKKVENSYENNLKNTFIILNKEDNKVLIELKECYFFFCILGLHYNTGNIYWIEDYTNQKGIFGNISILSSSLYRKLTKILAIKINVKSQYFVKLFSHIFSLVTDIDLINENIKNNNIMFELIDIQIYLLKSSNKNESLDENLLTKLSSNLLNNIKVSNEMIQKEVSKNNTGLVLSKAIQTLIKAYLISEKEPKLFQYKKIDINSTQISSLMENMVKVIYERIKDVKIINFSIICNDEISSVFLYLKYILNLITELNNKQTNTNSSINNDKLNKEFNDKIDLHLFYKVLILFPSFLSPFQVYYFFKYKKILKQFCFQLLTFKNKSITDLVLKSLKDDETWDLLNIYFINNDYLESSEKYYRLECSKLNLGTFNLNFKGEIDFKKEGENDKIDSNNENNRNLKKEDEERTGLSLINYDKKTTNFLSNFFVNNCFSLLAYFSKMKIFHICLSISNTFKQLSELYDYKCCSSEVCKININYLNNSFYSISLPDFLTFIVKLEESILPNDEIILIESLKQILCHSTIIDAKIIELYCSTFFSETLQGTSCNKNKSLIHYRIMFLILFSQLNQSNLSFLTQLLFCEYFIFLQSLLNLKDYEFLKNQIKNNRYYDELGTFLINLRIKYNNDKLIGSPSSLLSLTDHFLSLKGLKDYSEYQSLI